MDTDNTNEGMSFFDRMRLYGKPGAYLAFVIAAMSLCIGLGLTANDKFNQADKLAGPKATNAQEAKDEIIDPEVKHLNNLGAIYAALAVAAFFAAGVAAAASAKPLDRADAQATEFDVNNNGEDIKISFTDDDLKNFLDGGAENA